MVTHQWVVGGLNVGNSVHSFGSAVSLVTYMFSKRHVALYIYMSFTTLKIKLFFQCDNEVVQFQIEDKAKYLMKCLILFKTHDLSDLHPYLKQLLEESTSP